MTLDYQLAKKARRLASENRFDTEMKHREALASVRQAKALDSYARIMVQLAKLSHYHDIESEFNALAEKANNVE